MRRILPVGLLWLVAVFCMLWLGHAQLAAQSAAPGAGHGFLIDTHLKAGMACASCHKETPPAKAPDMSMCTNCHGSYDQIAAKTAADNPNPHASHQGQVPCATCHHVHQASESFCDQCHAFGMKVP